MLECWNEDHIKRPTFAVIEQKIEELLKSERYVYNLYINFNLYMYVAFFPDNHENRVNGYNYTQSVASSGLIVDPFSLIKSITVLHEE